MEFIFTETNVIEGKKPENLSINFTQQADGRVSCPSADYKKIVDTFVGADEIIYAESPLFDDYDFEIDDGQTVTFVPKRIG